MNVCQVDILCPVIDLCDFFERTRKILRLDLALRRKFKSCLCVCDRTSLLKGVVRRVAVDGDVIETVLVDGVVRAVTAHILVRRRIRVVAVVGGDRKTRPVRGDELILVSRTVRILHVSRAVVVPQHIPILCRRVLKRRRAVIDLVNARVPHKPQFEHATCDRAVARDLASTALKINAVQRIVLDLGGVAGRLYIIEYLCRAGDVRRRIVGVVRKLRPLVAQTEEHVVLISGNNSRSGSRRRCQMPPLRNVVVARAIVDLGRICRMTVEINHLEIGWRNVTAPNRAFAIRRIIDRIVSRCGRPELILKRIPHIRILHIVRRAVARVHVLCKGTARESSVRA